MHNLPSYRNPLWILGFVLVVASWFIPWGYGVLVTARTQYVDVRHAWHYLIWFVRTSHFTIVAVAIGFLASIFGLYYLPVEFGLEDTAFQGITALVSGFLVTFGALQWILNPRASSTPYISFLGPVFPFQGEILYGAYLAVAAGALIMIAGTDPLVRAGRNLYRSRYCYRIIS